VDLVSDECAFEEGVYLVGELFLVDGFEDLGEQVSDVVFLFFYLLAGSFFSFGHFVDDVEEVAAVEFGLGRHFFEVVEYGEQFFFWCCSAGRGVGEGGYGCGACFVEVGEEEVFF